MIDPREIDDRIAIRDAGQAMVRGVGSCACRVAPSTLSEAARDNLTFLYGGPRSTRDRPTARAGIVA